MMRLKQLLDAKVCEEKEVQLGKIRDVLLNKTAYDVLGKRLGVVVDAILTRTMNISKIILDDGQQLAKKQISAIGDVILIKVPKPQNARPKKKVEQKNEHMNIPTNAQPKQTEAVSVSVKPDAPQKRRRYGDFSFVLGKTADKNITNFYGEVMIRSGETVTREVLRQAKISGKLIELCLHAK